MLVMVFFRFCGLGHLRNVAKGLGDRERITCHLQLIFGDTFKPGAFFYANPDINQFIAVLLHIASNGRVRVNADTRRLFSKSTRGKCAVNQGELLKLGCTKAQLFETLRRTPGADIELRHADAAPLLLLSPDELLNNASSLVSNAAPPVFPAALPVFAAAPLEEVLNNSTGGHHPNPDHTFDPFADLLTDDDDSGYSGDLHSVTSTAFSSGSGGDMAAGGAALADCFTSDAPLDLGGPFPESFLETSELDDTARRLLLAEHELQATQHRIRLLLPQGDPAMLAVAAALDAIRETVRHRRTAVQEDHNASVARQLASVFL